jgi:competence protein ComEC
MDRIHFLNVLEGDCNIIQHDSGRVTVIDVSNADNNIDTPAEKAKKASEERKQMRNRTQVPSGKKDYGQKKDPDNPIDYLKNNLKISGVFRFIITHPDMDHLDGVKDFVEEFKPGNIWDTDNDKEIDFSENSGNGGYNSEDWEYYKDIRDRKPANRRVYYADNKNSYYTEDNIKILCPTPEIVKEANAAGEYNDLSYVLLFTPPKKNGETWKILFAGDSDDTSWNYILEKHKELVENVDVLFAPHHGRDSGRSYDFLKTLKPKITLFGNASSKHLAYSCYPETRITNNQAGYVIIEITLDSLIVYVKNYEFARDYKKNPKRNWSDPLLNKELKAYPIFQYNS